MGATGLSDFVGPLDAVLFSPYGRKSLAIHAQCNLLRRLMPFWRGHQRVTLKKNALLPNLQNHDGMDLIALARGGVAIDSGPHLAAGSKAPHISKAGGSTAPWGTVSLDYIYLIGGLIGLFLGGEALVRGSVGLARRMAISPLLIGLTVVGFGTSTPELLVSVDAAWRGVPDIALGNVIGSNIANILLIIGISALVWPIRVTGATLSRDCGVMMAATLAMVPVFAMGHLVRPVGLCLVAGLAGYLVWAYRHPGHGDTEAAALPIPASALAPTLWVITGLIALMLGARFLVDGAVNIARGFGLSEAFIGLSIVAVGTSLPELATSLIAALRRQSEIAIGNIVGSNIFNLLGILGVTGLITPIPVASRFLTFDLPVLLGVSALLSVLLLRCPKIGRGMGVVMLIGYAAYIWAARV